MAEQERPSVAVRRFTGCPCGHLEDEDCVRHLPVPRGSYCCLSMDHEEIEAASRFGFFCSPGVSCALHLLRVS